MTFRWLPGVSSTTTMGARAGPARSLIQWFYNHVVAVVDEDLPEEIWVDEVRREEVGGCCKHNLLTIHHREPLRTA